MNSPPLAPPPLALVTGGSRRIGQAIVEDLAANGFAVAIHCNGSRDEAQRLAEDVAAKGLRSGVFSADLTRLSEVKALFPAVTAELGPVSILVNNASIFEDDQADALNESVV